MTDQLKHFTVHLASVPGCYAQYSGEVAVWAEDEDQAIECAFRKLKRGAFPDRNRDMWKVCKVERGQS